MRLNRHLSLFLLLFLTVIWGNRIFAQISEGGVPPSFAFDNANLTQSAKAIVIQPNFDVKRQIELDIMERETGESLVPFTVGRAIPVDFNVDNSGEWLTLPDGTQIWRLTLKSPGAIATTLIYDEFQIPRGGKLFLYNAAKTQILGAYTEKNNREGKRFSTEFVAGDEVVLEYVAPVSFTVAGGKVINDAKPIIKISQLVYGYNYLSVVEGDNILQGKNDPWFGGAAPCHVNINCSPEGDDWQIQKTGVVRMVYLQGTQYGACTGTMINNTAQDLTPYLITAAHCIDNVAIDFETMMFYFHYEAPGCENISKTPEGTKTLAGADLLVEVPSSGGSDGGLLRLYDNVPLEYGAYFQGWDRRNIPATNGVGIHHPVADIKKISTFVDTPENGSWNGSGIIGAPNAHWRFAFAGTENGWGVTEQGSSGSPLFNQNGLLIGTLTGGSSSCTNKTASNMYGKLWYHWDQHPNSDSHMKPYLDPLDTGVETLPGIFVQQNYPEANFSASTVNPYVLTSVTYKDHSSFANSWEWTFEGGTPNSYVGEVPPVVTYNTLGTYTTKLVINKGTADEKTSTKTIIVKEKGDNPTAPKANFTFDKYGGSVFMTEGFDGEGNPFPPAGWTLDNHGTSPNVFVKGNFGSATLNFNLIDPASTHSVVAQRDENNVVDTWLKTDEFALPENAYIDFWAIYDGSRIEGGVLSVNISTDGGTTWTEIWTNGPDNQYVDWYLGWFPCSVTLSDYGGKNVRIGLRYYGQNGYWGGFDGIKLGTTMDPTQKVTIGVGEYVKPTDLSTGYPTVYKWEFPGGETTSSNLQEPDSVQYMTPGLYDVILTVKNAKGEDTRVFENAVEVVWQTPVPDYLATSLGGYTLTTHGPFAPKSAKVNIGDNTKKYPDTWNWAFEGATPSASTQQNPGWIEYNTPGTFGLTLKSANPAGEAELIVPEFAKIGYESPGNIWNMIAGEKGMTGYQSSYGHLTGTTQNIAAAYAERFDAPAEPGFIESVDIMFHVNSATSGNLTVKLVASTAEGLPVTTSALAQATLPVTEINTDGYTTVKFANKVFINEPFFIMVDGFRNKTTYDLYIPTSPDRGVEGKNTAYVHQYYNLLGLLWLPWGWNTIPAVFDGINVSLNIAPEFNYMYMELDGESVFDYKNVDSKVSTVNVKSNAEWSVKSLNSWIVLNASDSYEGDGSFTFTVQNNIYDTRKGLIEMSHPSGLLKKYVVVQQAGPAPIELIATVIDEPTGKIELTWEKPSFTTSIFEDVELHTAWTVNSPGQFGWSYIDGDGAATKNIGLLDYPNRGAQMAFQAWNVPLFPSSKPSSHFSKSGNQIFACPAAVGVPNDDWLISPELTFEEDFTFSFWAKSYSSGTPNYDEVIEVAYSTSGALATDFTVVATEHVTDKMTWVNFEYTIPANAKHVAIHCISNNQHMLMLDDLFIGVGEAPQSMYTINPNLNADPFGNENKSDVAEEYTPEQLQIIDAVKSGKTGSGEPIEITNIQTGELINTVIKAPIPSFDRKLELFEGNVSKDELVLGQIDTENASLPLTKLTYSSGVPTGNAIGSSEVNAELEVAIAFTAIELLPVHNTKIKAVDLYLVAAPADGITVNIREGHEIIHSQKVDNPSSGKFIRVILDKDVYVNASKELYVSYAYTQKPNQPVAGVDNGPAVKGKGDLISENGNSFQSLSNFGLNYNWLITVLVEDHHKVKDLSYVLYRDGSDIVTTNEMTYLDQIMTTKACYTVSAVYPNNLESTTSNDVCVTLPNIPKQPLTVTVEDVSRFYGDTNPAFVLHYDGFLDGHSEADLATAPVATCLADATSPVGTYDIVLSGGADLLYDFIYVDARLEVTERPISISADALSKVYGEADPVLTYTVTSGSLVNADAITGSLEREAGEDVGNYTIKQGTMDINTNYIITYVSNIFSITAKAQTITFPDIPEQTINGGSYILDATASSGLLVKYTVADVTVADLASDGKTVIFKKIGETQITAYVSPDPNYAAATPVTKVLKIKGSNDTSSTLTVSGANTAVAPYTVDCGISSILITVTPNDPYAMVTFNGQSYPNNQYSLATPKGGEYSVSVKVTASDGTTTKEDLLTFEKPFDFFEIGVVRFGNTLVVNNNSSTNGGYTFTAYAWYKDGQNVGNAQAYTNAAGLGTSSYYVVVTSSDGKTFSTCAQSFSSSGAMGVKAYPNPVGVGEQVNVEADLSAEMLEEAVIEVYDAGGVMIQREISVTNINQITMPYITGTYVIRLVSGDYEQTMKVVVK